MSRLTPDDLIGSWRLTRYVFRGADGGERPRYAGGAEGRLHYLPDGFMSAHLAASEAAPTGEDMLALSGDAARAALAGYLGYCGRWRIEGGRVRHDVEMCVRPDWIGRTVWRDAQLSDGVLRLTTDRSAMNAESGVAILDWVRA